MRRVIPIQPVVVARSAATPVATAAGTELVSLYEKQKKIYPRSVHGWFSRWRWALVWLTQALFYGLPWLSWNGRQSVLFDLAARRFFIFDLVLYPQDFIYLTGLLVLSAFGLFFVTAVAGRMWCGYACPQTVYTEIFLWVEHHIEGERGARIKLDAGPRSFKRLWRKSAKHGVWLAISLWTGFSFVGYFTPIHTLGAEALTLMGIGGPAAQGVGPWEWFWVSFYGLATYGNAGFLREQVCKYMCPYARFQSAMFDRDTMIVSYDTARGDPRGTRARGADLDKLGLGDCIDCGLCVHVCPVGIDIREGLQYECIACSACIDACDGVMDKMKYPRGLIRYATENGVRKGFTRRQMFKRVLRPRVLIYGGVLLAIAAAFTTSLSLRQTLKVDVVRDRGTLARLVDNGQIENLYRLQLMNATESLQRYRVGVSGVPGAELASTIEVDLPPAQARWVTLAVRVPPQAAAAIGPGAHAIRFRVTPIGHDADAVSEKSTFVVPR
ncbi:cytochrome c oxidase accessory protein CcoG [Aquabacterium sp.]|uniref:cytochrome c oxidase accessory protein CcoG n=1 Tax=Aquabacterium sp. TaxID=1872578 RepID=UPI002C948445|nr:cytochrome c oxidase accessory protein CcoG [Aquabacterium sp.]HSW05920.1 cytochrome c oxidase accessory protein CcoG [Aquabacterium sp.]